MATVRKIGLIIIIYLSQLSAQSQVTLIPDPNFEQALISQGLDTGPIDGQVPTANINGITYLNIVSKNISDLTGIQDFAGLDTLNCLNNNIGVLDLSQNSQLTILQCSNNNITNLDVSNSPNLWSIGCSSNQLTSINLSQNSQLEILDVWQNNITGLDISNCPLLYYLNCGENSISTLDLSQNPLLTEIVCHQNNIVTLDLSNCTVLNTLYCYSNNLMCLNLKNGNNLGFSFISFYDNPSLYCVEVDDQVYSTNNWHPWTNYYFDSWVSFGEYCANSCSTGIAEVAMGNKEVVKVLDLMGRETEPVPNTPLIYVYSDGTTEKVYKLE